MSLSKEVWRTLSAIDVSKAHREKRQFVLPFMGLGLRHYDGALP